jgi:phosphopantetheinyl transferase
MPFIQEINTANGVRVGIWQITETADELLDKIHLSDSETILYVSFRHELRKRQWLACRVLLKHLLSPLSAGLAYDPNGKPHLISGDHFISISHAGEFAAVVCSEFAAVGIDIEKLKDRVERVKERFLQKAELDSLSPSAPLEQLYVLWGGKEALYKLNGKPDLDFRNDIYVHPFDYLCNTNSRCKATITINGLYNDFTLFYCKIEDYMLVVAF